MSPAVVARNTSGTWVWPTRQWGVANADRLRLATWTENRYSHSGSRGLPWTSVKSSTSRRSGSASSQARVSSLQRLARPFHGPAGIVVEGGGVQLAKGGRIVVAPHRDHVELDRAGRRPRRGRGRSRRCRPGPRWRRRCRGPRARRRARPGCCGCPTGRRLACGRQGTVPRGMAVSAGRGTGSRRAAPPGVARSLRRVSRQGSACGRRGCAGSGRGSGAPCAPRPADGPGIAGSGSRSTRMRPAPVDRAMRAAAETSMSRAAAAVVALPGDQAPALRRAVAWPAR